MAVSQPMFSRILNDHVLCVEDASDAPRDAPHVVYTREELMYLKGKPPEVLIKIHQVKKSLGGHVLISDDWQRDQLVKQAEERRQAKAAGAEAQGTPAPQPARPAPVNRGFTDYAPEPSGDAQRPRPPMAAGQRGPGRPQPVSSRNERPQYRPVTAVPPPTAIAVAPAAPVAPDIPDWGA